MAVYRPLLVILFANFHKTKIQKVILRCKIGIHLNWFKSYDTKRNHFRFRFLQLKKQTNPSTIFCVLYVFCVFVCFSFLSRCRFGTSKWPSELTFVKGIHVVGKKMTRSGLKLAIYHLQVLGITIYILYFVFYLVCFCQFAKCYKL